MANFCTVVNIEARPDEVVKVLFDVERWPEWTSTMTSVRRLEKGPLAVGSKARVRQPNLLPAVWRVTELDSASGFRWVNQSIGLRLEAEHWVAGTDTGSKATLSFRFSGLLGPLAARFYGDQSKRYIDVEAEGLRKLRSLMHCHGIRVSTFRDKVVNPIRDNIIVKQHGASIAVETEPGLFTKFKIVLPRTNPR